MLTWVLSELLRFGWRGQPHSFPPKLPKLPPSIDAEAGVQYWEFHPLHPGSVGTHCWPTHRCERCSVVVGRRSEGGFVVKAGDEQMESSRYSASPDQETGRGLDLKQPRMQTAVRSSQLQFFFVLQGETLPNPDSRHAARVLGIYRQLRSSEGSCLRLGR